MRGYQKLKWWLSVGIAGPSRRSIYRAGLWLALLMGVLIAFSISGIRLEWHGNIGSNYWIQLDLQRFQARALILAADLPSELGRFVRAYNNSPIDYVMSIDEGFRWEIPPRQPASVGTFRSSCFAFRTTVLIYLLALWFCIRSLKTKFSERRLRAGGLCAQCAYDLEGNTSGVCPECGTRVATPESSQ